MACTFDLSRTGLCADPASTWLDFVTNWLAVTDRYRTPPPGVLRCSS
jgi:hypothetical protein